MKIEIKYNAAALKRVAAAFPKAAASAINKTLAMSKTALNKQIRQKYNIKANAVAAAIRIYKASRTRLAAAVVVKGIRQPLIDFSARQVRAGTSVAVSRGQRKVIAHAFIAQMKSGKIGVFKRIDKPMKSNPKRQAIEMLFTIAVSEMAASQESQAVINKTIEANLERILTNEINYFKG